MAAGRQPPAGSVGAPAPERNAVPFKYQMAVLRPAGVQSNKSGFPSLLKSAAPATAQPVGRTAPPRKVPSFRYHTASWCVSGLYKTQSGKPSPLKSAFAVETEPTTTDRDIEAALTRSIRFNVIVAPFGGATVPLRTVRLAILVWEVPAKTVPKTTPNALPGPNPPLSVNKGTIPVSVKERSELLRL